MALLDIFKPSSPVRIKNPLFIPNTGVPSPFDRPKTSQDAESRLTPGFKAAGQFGRAIGEAVSAPGSLFITPTLEKFGVPAGAAAIAGLAGDIAAPFPGGKAKAAGPVFKGFTDLSTSILEKLKGRSFVSKQFISDLTNSAELRQPERDLIRNLLKDQSDVVPVKQFAGRVKTELLPLERTHTEDLWVGGGSHYESTSLPDELRGPIADYSEHVYESPIKTSAGQVHGGLGQSENYFAHTRVEDLPASTERFGPYDFGPDSSSIPGNTRRVIEIQSDLFQKGRLEGEADKIIPSEYGDMSKGWTANNQAFKAERQAEIAKLEPYRNTWHERVIREEVKQAAKDGKTTLQFPTGETAMKIEGLGGENQIWSVNDRTMNLTPSMLNVGRTINQGANIGNEWVIIDVLGDGKFKATPKRIFAGKMPSAQEYEGFFTDKKFNTGVNIKEVTVDGVKYYYNPASTNAETFDISGKIDTQNPIYRFYEKEVGRFLTNKFGAKVITDPQGVKWYELDIAKDQKKNPILAFGKSQVGALVAGAAATGGLAAGTIPSTQSYNAPVYSQKAPLQPKNKIVSDEILKTALFQLESSGGTNKSSADEGEVKWHTGLTEIAIKELQRLNRLPENFDRNNQQSVLEASVEYFKLMRERFPGKTDAEVYVDHYWTQSTSSKQRERRIGEFNSLTQ